VWVDRQAVTKVNIKNMVSLRFLRKKIRRIYNLYCAIRSKIYMLFCYSVSRDAFGGRHKGIDPTEGGNARGGPPRLGSDFTRYCLIT